MSGDNAFQERQRELFARLAAERFDVSEISLGEAPNARGRSTQREMWNAGSLAAERIIRQWLAEERVYAGLEELRSTPAMDLRLRDALILGSNDDGSATILASPVAAHDSSLVCQHAAGRAQEPALLDEALVFDERVFAGEFDLSDAEVA